MSQRSQVYIIFIYTFCRFLRCSCLYFPFCVLFYCLHQRNFTPLLPLSQTSVYCVCIIFFFHQSFFYHTWQRARPETFVYFNTNFTEIHLPVDCYVCLYYVCVINEEANVKMAVWHPDSLFQVFFSVVNSSRLAWFNEKLFVCTLANYNERIINFINF